MRLPDGATLDWLRLADAREGVDLRDCATAVCVLDGRLLLAAQWCAAPARAVLEFPGGVLDPGESSLDAARRECAEETGVLPGRLEHAGSYLLDNRRSNRRMHVFVGTECHRVAPVPEVGEVISVGLVTIEDFEQAVRAGEVENAVALAGWLLAREAVVAAVRADG